MITKGLLIFCLVLSLPITTLCMKEMNQEVEDFFYLIKPWKGHEELINTKRSQAQEKDTWEFLDKDKKIHALFKSKTVELYYGEKSDELTYSELIKHLAALKYEETSEKIVSKKSKRKWCCFQ